MIFQGGWRSTTKQIYHEIIGICSMDPRGCWNITVLCLKKGRPVGHLRHSYVKTFFRYESEIERGSRWWVSGWQVRFLNVPNLGDFIGFMGISLNLIMTSRRDITGMIVMYRGIISKWPYDNSYYNRQDATGYFVGDIARSTNMIFGCVWKWVAYHPNNNAKTNLYKNSL